MYFAVVLSISISQKKQNRRGVLILVCFVVYRESFSRGEEWERTSTGCGLRRQAPRPRGCWEGAFCLHEYARSFPLPWGHAVYRRAAGVRRGHPAFRRCFSDEAGHELAAKGGDLYVHKDILRTFKMCPYCIRRGVPCQCEKKKSAFVPADFLYVTLGGGRLIRRPF